MLWPRPPYIRAGAAVTPYISRFCISGLHARRAALPCAQRFPARHAMRRAAPFHIPHIWVGAAAAQHILHFCMSGLHARRAALICARRLIRGFAALSALIQSPARGADMPTQSSCIRVVHAQNAALRYAARRAAPDYALCIPHSALHPLRLVLFCAFNE